MMARPLPAGLGGCVCVGVTGEGLVLARRPAEAAIESVGVSVSAKEESKRSREIGVLVNRMDQIARHNAAMVEETSAASDTLKLEADRLRELIAAFRFEDGREERSPEAGLAASTASRAAGLPQGSLRVVAGTASTAAMAASFDEAGWVEI